MLGVRVTFIVLHAHTSVLVHHFRTWPYMRTRAFLAVSFITNYRVYIYIYIYIYAKWCLKTRLEGRGA